MQFQHTDLNGLPRPDLIDSSTIPAHLAAIVESTDDAIVSKSLDGIINSWNRGAERMFGYAKSEALGKPIRIIIPDDRQAEEDMIVARISRGEKIEHFETKRQRKDGSLVEVSVSVSPIYNAAGQVVGAAKIARDISERIRAESVSARLSAIIESSDDAIVSKDLNGVIHSWNRGAERLFGYLAEEIVGKPIEMLLPVDRKDEEKGILKRLRRGERVDHFETVRIRKDGRPVHVSVTISPIRDSSGRVIGASKVARDISERKMFETTALALQRDLEQRIRERTEELETAHQEMSSFTYSIAHDIRAPLRAIVANSMMIVEDFGDKIPAEAREMLDRQALAAKQLAKLVDDLLAYSRLGRSEVDRVEVDVTDLVRTLASTFEDENHPIRVQDGMVAEADHSLLTILFHNLVDNAVKYSPGGGEVFVGRSDATFFVRDRGVGFDMAYAEKVFEPFERLVSVGEVPGTGIGLASAKRIVQKHGGSIWASSTPGEGTTIYFTLPR